MSAARCEHGFLPGNCPEDGCLYRREVKTALLGLAGSMTAASDQAQAMTDAQLGKCLLAGKWTTIEIHEAGRRLAGRAGGGSPTKEQHVCTPERTDDRTVTCPVCHAVYVLDEDATADERSCADG